MRIYRISHFADLRGDGGRRAGRALASQGAPGRVLREQRRGGHARGDRVHRARGSRVSTINISVALEIELPDDVSREVVSLDPLPADWRQNLAHTRTLGTIRGEDGRRRPFWSIRARGADRQCRLNTAATSRVAAHAGQGNIHIVRVRQYPFDSRLFEGPVRKS